MAAVNAIYFILRILGSLGLFLFGMKIMSDGLQKTAGESLHKIMHFMTSNRLMAVFTGFTITALIQSSSATTVMVVSFVNAGLLNLSQAIGVVMGANIGTTVTGWIVAIIGFKFKITAIALPAIGIGLPLLFNKRFNSKNLGEVLIGFGILFIGLDFLKKSVPNIQDNPQMLEFVIRFTNFGFFSFIFFVFIGTLLTIIVQSSSAAMAITITMANLGWINFGTAAAIILGENIGTTITAYLASLGTNVHARRASRAHTLFNIIGVLWIALCFPLFLRLVEVLVPGTVLGVSMDSAKIYVPAHLAMFHTLFNLINTFIFLLFVPQFTRFIETIVNPTEVDISSRYQLKFISTSLQNTPELHILNARSEISKMTEIINNMFIQWFTVFKNPTKKLGNIIENIKELENYTDQMEEQISTYLVTISSENLNPQGSIEVSSLLRIVNELESIGDTCYKLIVLSQQRYNKKIKFKPVQQEELFPYCKNVEKFLNFISLHLNQGLSEEELEEAKKIEASINKRRNVLKKAARKRIQQGSSVKAELLYIDIVRQIEHIGDFCLNIAESMQTVSQNRKNN